MDLLGRCILENTPMNTILILVIAIIEILCLIELVTLKKEWHYGFISANLFLVTLLGAKIISFSSFITNAGNIFYVSAVIGMLLLIEAHGKRSAFESILAAVLNVGLSIIMIGLVIGMRGPGSDRVFDQALYTLFSPMPRIAFASLSSFVFTQSIAIYFFHWLKEKKTAFFSRLILAVLLSQMLDSLIFFSVAFSGKITSDALIISVLLGLCLKVGFAIIASPFIIVRMNAVAKI